MIDDIELSKLSPHRLLQLVDKDYEHGIDVKYGYGYIPAHLPRIICLNSMDFFWNPSISPILRQAISRRIKIHIFTKKLFSVSDKLLLPNNNCTKYKPHPSLNLEPKEASPMNKQAIIIPEICQPLGWMSKAMLKSAKVKENDIEKIPETMPIIDPEQLTPSKIDIFDEANKIGMAEPLPKQYKSFLKWLQMKKKREIIDYIDLKKFEEPAEKKIVIDLDDRDNESDI